MKNILKNCLTILDSGCYVDDFIYILICAYLNSTKAFKVFFTIKHICNTSIHYADIMNVMIISAFLDRKVGYQGAEGGMMDFCYTAIGVFLRRKITRRTRSSIGNHEARPLLETHFPSDLSRGTGRGAFSTQPKITSYFQIRHKGLAMEFSYQEAIG